MALLLICLALLPTSVRGVPNNPIDPPCTPFSGAFAFTLFQFTGPTIAEGKGTVLREGEQIGSFSANYFNIEQRGQGIIQLNGKHTITLAGGTLVTHDEIHLQATAENPAVMRANSRLYIVRGTGIYDGATGLLHTHGAFNVNTLEGSIDFSGKVCVP